MDFLQTLQERYIQEFSNNVPLGEFLVNLLVPTLLTRLLRLFFIHFGSAVSNRRRFANNFLPLALGTLLIIMIVKSSIALSLGLVGALSTALAGALVGVAAGAVAVAVTTWVGKLKRG